MSARRSWRMVSRRKRASQARVRSTTQRCRPRRSGRSRRSARHRRWSWALQAVELAGPAAWPSTAAAHAGHDAGHDVEHGREHGREQAAVVAVRAARLEAERRALSVNDEVALRARPPAVRRVRADLRLERRAPPFAAIEALSIDARLQSSRSASASRSSRMRCSRPHTPAACQSRSRRQHVIPVQPNRPPGSIAQGIPERSTKTMPSSTLRSSHRGRPPFGFGGSSGSSGATAAHSSSLTRDLVMAPQRARGGFCYSL